MEKKIREILTDVFNSKGLFNNIEKPSTFIFNTIEDVTCTVVIDFTLKQVVISHITTKKKCIKCDTFKYSFTVCGKSVKLLPLHEPFPEYAFIICNFAKEIHNKLTSLSTYILKPILSSSTYIHEITTKVSTECTPEHIVRFLGDNVKIYANKNKNGDSYYVKCELNSGTAEVARIEINNFKI